MTDLNADGFRNFSTSDIRSRSCMRVRLCAFAPASLCIIFQNENLTEDETVYQAHTYHISFGIV